jgi:hypothetical protein
MAGNPYTLREIDDGGEEAYREEGGEEVQGVRREKSAMWAAKKRPQPRGGAEAVVVSRGAGGGPARFQNRPRGKPFPVASACESDAEQTRP